MFESEREFGRIQFIVDSIWYPGYQFRCGYIRKEDPVLYYVQVVYMEPDVLTGVNECQEGRLWVFGPGQTESQIIQTCFKGLLTSLEHRAREHFKWEGKPVLMPHLDLHKIWMELP